MEDIRDYGAKVDGVTNDTQAVRKAKKAAGAGGTIYFPAGTTIVDSKDRTGPECLRFVSKDTEGISLVGDGPGKSIVKVEGGHTDNHKGITYYPDYNHDGAEIKNLTFDGNWSEQSPTNGDWMNAFGVHIRGDNQQVTIENCVFKNWVTNGGLLGAAGITVKNSTFRDNGWGVAQEGREGHGFNVYTRGGSGRVTVENCLFDNNVGQAIDSRGGSVSVRNTVMKIDDAAIKLNGPTDDVLLENVQIIGKSGTRIPIKCVPTGDEGTGTLRLYSIVIENAGWPAIDLPRRPGSIEGDNILIKNVDTGGQRNAGFYIDSSRTVNIGKLSIHDVSGSALRFSGASGTIDELVYSGVSDVGDSDGVSITTSRAGDPIAVAVPSASQVGAGTRSTSGDNSTDDTTGKYGNYNQPDPGTVDWHVPLNENFSEISSDLESLAQRIDVLESRL